MSASWGVSSRTLTIIRFKHLENSLGDYPSTGAAGGSDGGRETLGSETGTVLSGPKRPFWPNKVSSMGT